MRFISQYKSIFSSRYLVQFVFMDFAMAAEQVYTQALSWRNSTFSSPNAIVFALNQCRLYPKALNNIRRWLYPFQGNPCEWHRVPPKKLSPWICWSTDTPWLSMEYIHPKKSTVLIIPWSLVCGGDPCFVHVYETSHKLILITLEHRQTLFWSVLKICCVYTWQALILILNTNINCTAICALQTAMFENLGYQP